MAINPDLTRTPLLIPDERWTSDTEAALEAIEDDILADNANQSGNSIAWHEMLKLEDVEPAALESFQNSYASGHPILTAVGGHA